MTTEAEARSKWCPFFRASIACSPIEGNQYATNRFDLTSSAHCLGSGCMAWRTIETAPMSEQHGYGYCGLAGKS
jgi:hypothetical protein